jgi:hypothetical protein
MKTTTGETTVKLTTKDLMAALRKFDNDATDKVGAMQLMDTDILLAAALGRVDLNQVAALMVAARGMGRSGEWVGFLEAERQMDEAIAKLATRTSR